MSRRGRSLAFLAAAVAAAVAAAALADRYGSQVAGGYGPLRRVVVLAADLPAGGRLGPERIATSLTVRRVPVRFVPPGALSSPAEALGLAVAAPLPAGSYLQAAQLRPAARRRSGGRLGRGRGPVEIAVSGAGALLAAGRTTGRRRVDVVVTGEPRGAGAGRTYVAARRVPLLALRPGGDAAAPGTAAATLGLTRGEALRLIAAESFARKVTLLAAG